MQRKIESLKHFLVNYIEYLVEDFVLDYSFKDWVLHMKYAQNVFWELWLAQHPEKYLEIREARKIVLILHNHFSPGTNGEVESRWQEICN